MPETNVKTGAPLLLSYLGTPSVSLLLGCIFFILGAYLPSPFALLFIGLGSFFFGTTLGIYLICTLFPDVPLKELKSYIEKLKKECVSAEDKYRLLTDNLAAAVVIRNEKDVVTYCSPYTEVLTGYALSEIYSSTEDFFRSIVHEEDRENYERASKVIIAGEPFQYRSRFFHKSGIEMWVETHTVPIIGDQGEVVSSLSVMLDITGPVRYQRQVEERNKDLQEFTYMISHDLKAPIFTIKGMLRILEEDAREILSDDLKETLVHTSRATQRLEQLVGSVLEYAKVSTGEVKNDPVSVDEVLTDVLEDYTHQIASSGATVTINRPLPSVLGDRLRISQIFSNLLGNAIKYRDTSRPLVVTISTGHVTNPRYACITVTDNGIGIPAQKRESVFRPFQRGHSTTIDGMGIGLACVKKILDKFGGSVELQSTEGVGSTFAITLRQATPIDSPPAGIHP